MNALVEDQMVRMRRILDADDQLDWLRRERHGHRFYFGRYTGQTPHRDLQRVMRALRAPRRGGGTARARPPPVRGPAAWRGAADARRHAAATHRTS